nr:reverse transcriptase domain-containing protein [Tanacetum cinerariifolium]
MDDSRSSLSRSCPDVVARSLTPLLDRSRWRRFMPVASSSCSVNNTSLLIWCRTPSESWRQHLDQPSNLKSQRNPSLTTTSGNWRRHTFYNGLNENEQDSLNAMAGGNILSMITREALNVIENKSKVHYSLYKPNFSRMNTNSKETASKTDDRIDKLADQISTLIDIFAKKVVTPATVKAVEESCVTCGGNHANYNCDIAINRVFMRQRGGNPTSTFEPIIFDSFLSFTPFEGSDFILEEIKAYLKDDSISPEIDHVDCDSKGDICLIEKLLNDDLF